MMEPALKELAGTLAKAGAPALGTIIGGAIGGPLGALVPIVLTSLAEALGTDPTPEAVDRAIKADPSAAAEKIQQAESRAVSELELRLKDTQDAREQTVKLVEQGSSIAWGSPVVSILVVLGFFAALFMFLAKPIPLSEGQAAVLNILLGSVSLSFGQVVNYWLGSSVSSRDKDATLSKLITAPTAPKAGKK